tara:strand:+ start:85 stop:936 length:852 start_codon:yes stop_codon:yes gene_type:complete
MSTQYYSDGMKHFERYKGSANIADILVKFTTKIKGRNGEPMTPASQATALSNLKRRIITTHFKGKAIPEAVQNIKFPAEFYHKINNTTEKNLQEKSEERQAVPDGRALMNTVLPGLKSKEFGELFTAVALATGRRTSELLYSGTLTPVPKARGGVNDPYKAVFTGQLKKRGGEGTPYTIPLLAPFDEVNDALERLQEMAGKEEAIHATALNRAVNTVTKQVIPFAVSPSSLRKLYTILAYSLTKSKATLPFFASQVLGHDGMGSAPYYIVYDIKKIGAKQWRQ